MAGPVGSHPESVRRWKHLWEQGGAQALRWRPAGGRPPGPSARRQAEPVGGGHPLRTHPGDVRT
ncbi:helix-turn-helix domain-containing protein [Streptomyces luteoverticillatus]|uniref:Helix-turn-helix domain-containing protein n=1 Tax=Streptomyces luteoverticillatus TaxID=66425 RepID=A0A3S9PSK6_STRLT|nr:helix-turn-helix domain-containing protein [Streptomyces luteoverticillatus]